MQLACAGANARGTQERSSSSSGSSTDSSTSSDGPEQSTGAFEVTQPRRVSKGVAGQPSQTAAKPQTRALARGPSGSDAFPGNDPGQAESASRRQAKGRVLANALSGGDGRSEDTSAQGMAPKRRALKRNTSSSNSFAGDASGQGRMPKGRALVKDTSSSSFAGDASGQAGTAPPESAPAGDLRQCEGCGRSFNQKAFEVHARICAKVFQVRALTSLL